VALLIGEAMFFAFLIAHGLTIGALLLQLQTGAQTDDEKERDYKQLAESAIAVGVGLLLLLLAWLAGVIAEGVASLVGRIKLPAGFSRFLRGVGAVRKVKPGAPRVDPVALAVEQELAAKVGGELATLLVAELGPQVAKEVVERLGPAVVRRLGTEITPQAMLAIARNLPANVVERLLAGGLKPRMIAGAVAAGQSARLSALTADQITRLAALSENGFDRIIRLPEAQFRRFVVLPEPQLRAFGEMNANGFNRFALLDDAAFARFRVMSPDQINALAAMNDRAFDRFVALDDPTFAKLNTANARTLARWGAMNDPTFAEIENLLRNAKVRDAAELEALLTNAKIANPQELADLLASPKIQDAAQVRDMLASAKIVDGRQLQRLVGSPKVADGAELQRLIARYQSGGQLEVLLAAPEVASGHDLIRLANVMDQAGVANATTGALANDALARFAQPHILGELEATAAMQNAGRIRGLDDWIRFSARKDPADLNRTVAELSVARRLANENPGAVINVAGDANAPLRPGTNERLPSFDITVEGPRGNVIRSIEVTTIDAPVSREPQITPGIRHASDKAAERIASGNPIPGDLEVNIRMQVDVGVTPQGGVMREVLPDGTVNLRRPDTGAIVRTSNIFDDFADHLATIQDNALLNRVTLVELRTGNVLAVYERHGPVWTRVR
jgi:hypothetical protein